MTQAVRELIIEPLVERYPPPWHLRHSPEAQERALADYEAALANFDRGVLAQAWVKVVAAHDYWCWPTPAAFVAACESFAPRRPVPSEEERRREKAQSLADDFVGRYLKTSKLAKLARRECWLPPLRDYVQEAAWVQAQLLCGVRAIGWTPHTLLGDEATFRSSQEAFDAYRPQAEKAVKEGEIRVTVPRALIRQWKEAAAAEGGRAADGPG